MARKRRTAVEESRVRITDEFLSMVGRGEIDGHCIIKLPGRNEIVGSTALVDISEIPSVGVLAHPGGVGLEIVSSDVNDTAAGTGIQSVKITYIQETTFEQLTETVPLNGTTVVTTTATDIERIQWISAESVGSVGVSVGNISLQGLSGGAVFEYIVAGGNQSLSSRYTVPANTKCYLINWNWSAVTKRIDFFLRATCDKWTRELKAGVFLFQDFSVANIGTSSGDNGLYERFPEQCEIKISGKAASPSGSAGVSFSLMCVDES